MPTFLPFLHRPDDVVSMASRWRAGRSTPTPLWTIDFSFGR
jgi:hypothetical protein